MNPGNLSIFQYKVINVNELLKDANKIFNCPGHSERYHLVGEDFLPLIFKQVLCIGILNRLTNLVLY